MYMNVYTIGADTVSDTRRDLTVHVARFRREGIGASPVVFGDHRRPEAVLLPFDTFQALLDIAEDAAIAERIRQRTTADSGTRTPLADVAAQFGIDLTAL